MPVGFEEGNSCASILEFRREESESGSHNLPGKLSSQRGRMTRLTWRHLREAGLAARWQRRRIVKPVLDGLNGIAFFDDAQVVRVNAAKRFGERNEIVVEMERL